MLHLFANHKVTGPAELALETCRALVAAGVPAELLTSDVTRTKHRDRWLHLLALERGVPVAPIEGLRLGKHHKPVRTWLDARRLAAALRARPPRLVHCHLPNDHLIAAMAVERSGLRLPLVRTLYDAEAPAPTRRTRRTLRGVARLVCLSRAAADAVRAGARALGVDPGRVEHLEPPIDTDRFDPARGVPARRAALGLAPDDLVVGIVARMQTHRRYEVLLEAVRLARAELPRLRLVVVGRGTKQDEVAREPVRRLGLEDAVTFAGHVSGDDYVGTLAAFDLKVFMVPGSDGTCRAVREALAMALPVVTTRQGILPELVREGETGLLVAAEPEAPELAAALVALGRDAGRRAAMSAAARADAVARFAYPRHAARLAALYDAVCAGG